MKIAIAFALAIGAMAVHEYLANLDDHSATNTCIAIHDPTLACWKRAGGDRSWFDPTITTTVTPCSKLNAEC